jgi:hypothetical protein
MSKNLTRSEDYSKWYNELVVKADLAENSGVRGCMVMPLRINAKKQASWIECLNRSSKHIFPFFVRKCVKLIKRTILTD